MLRLERLHLTNLRGVEALELEFSPRGSTVIVGVNGSGKTTVLVAIAELLARFVRAVWRRFKAGVVVADRDLRHGESRGSGSIVARIAPPGCEAQRWEGTFALEREPGEAAAFVRTRATALEQWLDALSQSPATSFPMLAYYSAEREYEDGPDASLGTSAEGQLASYVDAFRARGSFSVFAGWFREREDLENEKIRDDRNYRDPMLVAVGSAIASLLGGTLGSLRVRRAGKSGAPALVVRKQGMELDLDQLSHGERGLLALAGDIARRLAMTHPGLENPLEGHGVVLIDEIELHLHPQWQRKVIPSLEQTFPNVQFVVTTHSPQVLSLVRPEQLRILDGFSLVAGAPHTYGRDSNSILYEVMGVEQYPTFAAERVRKVSQLIDAERWDEAKRELDALSKDFGPGDAEVVRLGSMLEVLRDDGDGA